MKLKCTTLMVIGVLLAAVPIILNFVPACGTAAYCGTINPVRSWVTTPLFGGAFLASSWMSWWVVLTMPVVAVGIIAFAFGYAKYLQRPRFQRAF